MGEINVDFQTKELIRMDKQFFLTEVKAAERSLYRVARSYLSCDADAADAVQNALGKAWMKRDSLRDERLFRTWLTRIVINECVTFARHRKRFVPMADPPEPPPTPNGALGDLRQAMAELPPVQRVTVTLFYLDGYTLEEIASMLRVPLGTVKNRLFRARRQLRIDLKGGDDDEA